jgi:hypothetical protein
MSGRWSQPCEIIKWYSILSSWLDISKSWYSASYFEEISSDQAIRRSEHDGGDQASPGRPRIKSCVVWFFFIFSSFEVVIEAQSCRVLVHGRHFWWAPGLLGMLRNASFARARQGILLVIYGRPSACAYECIYLFLVRDNVLPAPAPRARVVLDPRQSQTFGNCTLLFNCWGQFLDLNERRFFQSQQSLPANWYCRHWARIAAGTAGEEVSFIQGASQSSTPKTNA